MIFYAEALRRRRAANPRPRRPASSGPQPKQRSWLSPSLLLLTIPLMLIPVATSLALLALLLTLICSRRARRLSVRALERLRAGWFQWRNGRRRVHDARELAELQALEACPARSGREPGRDRRVRRTARATWALSPPGRPLSSVFPSELPCDGEGS